MHQNHIIIYHPIYGANNFNNKAIENSILIPRFIISFIIVGRIDINPLLTLKCIILITACYSCEFGAKAEFLYRDFNI